MKKILKPILLLIALSFIYFVYANYPRLNIITGFASKSVASGVFLANRTQESVEQGDNDFPPIDQAKNTVDLVQQSVTSSFFGLKTRKAIYVDGLGAILLNKDYKENQEFIIPKRDKTPKNLPFPYGDLPQIDNKFINIDYKVLQNAVDNAFDKPNENNKKTRTVLVVYKDQIIAEKYADGFDKNTPMLGWSMTKSLTATMYGILQKQGKMDVNSVTGIEEWQKDDRKNITYNNLLQMNSGLQWVEDYNTLSDVSKMLFLETEMGKVQLEKPLTGKSNESWNYSSGTTNLLAGHLLQQQFKSQQEYLDFWYSELLDKIGMHSALIESDLAGNFVGSSYGWANTRDWAKFGLLYLHKGNWNGEQIISPKWVEYVATPTNGSDGKYGAHFWLNAGDRYPDVPKDLFSANGFQGQFVFIIPSKEIVIVRTGLTEDPEFDVNGFLRDILASIE
ncbi:MAG: serine hydrolase [Flavobacteriaceae bacterium]|nr:serine hydrolase [Flavobacteriaceae bacterium]